VIDAIADKSAGLAGVGNVNVDEQVDLALQYHITTVPTTLFFVRGELVERLLGVRPQTHVSETLRKLLRPAAHE
jgi:thioredoxin 1